MAASSPGYPAVRWTCPRPPGSEPEEFPLTSYDLHAFHTFAPITLGYRFPVDLEPTSLCQSLSETLLRFPAFSGRVTCADGQYTVQTWAHEPSVTAVAVPPDVLRAPAQWPAVAEQFPLRPGGVAGAVLFQALLLHAADPAAGCVLVVAVDHAMADAGTCALLLSTWSRLHRALFGARSPREVMDSLPEDFQRPEQQLLVRRFHFRRQRLAALKDVINTAIGDQSQAVTSNDVLLAACARAAATAPDARHLRGATQPALLMVVVDPRGRGLPQYFMGNGARPIAVEVEWAALLSHDLSTAALAVHATIRRGLAALRGADLHAAPAAPARPPFLQWNSWLRVEGLLDVDFGTALCEFDWVAVRALRHSHQFVVFPVTPGGGCALQVALPAAAMAHFVMEWDAFLGPDATWEEEQDVPGDGEEPPASPDPSPRQPQLSAG